MKCDMPTALREAVRELECVEEALQVGCGSAFLVVVGHQELVRADCREDHGAVVRQAPVPDAGLQFEEVFQLGVEGFDTRLASRVEGSTPRRLPEASSAVSQAAATL